MNYEQTELIAIIYNLHCVCITSYVDALHTNYNHQQPNGKTIPIPNRIAPKMKARNLNHWLPTQKTPVKPKDPAYKNSVDNIFALKWIVVLSFIDSTFCILCNSLVLDYLVNLETLRHIFLTKMFTTLLSLFILSTITYQGSIS